MSANNAGPSSSFTSASFSSYRLLPRAVCASQKRERRERRRRRRRRVNPRFNLRRDTKIRGRVARITRILFSRPHRYENRSFFHLDVDRIFPIRIVSRIVRDRIFSSDEIRISYRRTVVASWLDPSAAILRWSRDKTRSSSTSFFFSLHGPFLIIVITNGRPFAHALFSPSFIPLRASLPMPSPSTYPPSSSDRIRPGQLHFFPARGRNKTMISVSRPFPTCLASA